MCGNADLELPDHCRISPGGSPASVRVERDYRMEPVVLSLYYRRAAEHAFVAGASWSAC
jgi:hypothetical protein